MAVALSEPTVAVPMVRLGEAIELAYGKNLPKKKRLGGNIPVYGSNGIVGWHNEAVEHNPTVIVGRKGSVGAVRYVDQPCFPIDTTYYVKPRFGFDFDIQYLYYLLKKLDLSRLKTATGVPGLTRDDAYKELIPVPPLDEQHFIVDILKRADGIRRLRKQAQDTARQIIPALFTEMFGDPLTNPRDWPEKSLGNLVSLHSGGTPSKKNPAYWGGVIPWVSPKDMKSDCISDSIDHVTPTALEETTLKWVPAESVLIVVRGMILVHTVPIRINSTKVTINQDMKALVPNKELSANYLRWTLQCMHSYVLSQVSTSAHGTRKLDTDLLLALSIPLPPLSMQKEFESRLDSIQSILNQQEIAKNSAESSFQSLLHRAFNGGL